MPNPIPNPNPNPNPNRNPYPNRNRNPNPDPNPNPKLDQSSHDLDDEIEGWYIKYKLRKKTHANPRAGDITVVDPVDGKSYASIVGVRRKLGL